MDTTRAVAISTYAFPDTCDHTFVSSGMLDSTLLMADADIVIDSLLTPILSLKMTLESPPNQLQIDFKQSPHCAS